MIASNEKCGRAKRTIGTRMLVVRAFHDGSCKGFVYDLSEAGIRPRKVAVLTGDLDSPSNARGRKSAVGYADWSREVGGYWGDTPLSPDGFKLAVAAIREARMNLAKIRKGNALDTMRKRSVRPQPGPEWQEDGYVGPMRVREEHEAPEAVQGRVDAAMRHGGIQPGLKAFTVRAHLGTKRSGTYHGTSGASAKAAAARDWGMKPEDLTATEDPP